jgi:hypothetical protein
VRINMKNIFLDIWSGIKKSRFLFFFIFIQIVITSVVLYSMLATYYWTEEQSEKVQITWGDKEYLKVLPYMNSSSKIRVPIMFSNPKVYAETEHDRHKNLLMFYDIDSFCKEIAADPDITDIVDQNNFDIVLYNPKNWSIEDKQTSEFDIFRSEDGSYQPYDIVRAYIVSSNYIDFFDIKLSEGDYFKEEDYLYEGDYVPVLMGSIYKKYYTLGEEFEGMLNSTTNTKFKVIGFIAENQYFTTSNSTSSLHIYDNYIVVPYLEKDLDGCIAAGRLDLFTSRFVNSFFVCAPQKLDEVRGKIDGLLEKYGLSDVFYTFRCRIQKELASNYVDKLSISVAACIVTLLFSLFSFIFTMLFKINDNIKNYAIRIVVGETYSNIAFRYLFESFVVFFLGQLTGYFVFKIYSVNSFIYEGYDYLEEPTLRTGILLNIAFYIITAIILCICVNVKLRTYSLATLIRGSEVKRERRVPLYRAVIFIMLAIVGVFGMFISSYKVADSRIDIYYTGFLTKNARASQVSKMASSDAPEVLINIDKIGEKVNDAIIFRFINTIYKGDDCIEERGLYFNGYIDPVNMLEGRFFTAEETAEKRNKTVVVGKEIYNKYVTFDEEGKAYYYCDDLDTNLEVIGVMGKEDRETALDFLVITTLKYANEKLGPEGNYVLDAKDASTAKELEDAFIEHSRETANAYSYKYSPRITVEAPTDMLLMLLIIIIINATVFCFYYVSKQGHIHGVKKIIGYSKLMILTDTFFDFLLLTLGAFVTGNALVILLKETVFKEVQLFSIYMLDPQVIIISLVAVVALTVLLSVIAIARTFTSGKSNEYRV